VKDFREFIERGIIKKQSQNLSRAKDLIEESERKYRTLKSILTKIGLTEDNANDIIEYSYDILIGLIRSKLYMDGFKSSGEGAHEAEISYLINLGFGDTESRFMDELRYFRNRIKYYGKKLDSGYAKKVLAYLEDNYRKLKNKIKL